MDLGGIFNAGEEVEFERWKFTLKDLDIEQRGRFGAWLKHRAKAEAARSMSEDLPEEWVRLQASIVAQDIAAGLYDWGAAASLKSITCTREGASYSLFLIISAQCPDFDEAAAQRYFDDRLTKLAESKEFAEYLARSALDPPASSGRTGSSPTGPSASRGSKKRATRKTKSKR